MRLLNSERVATGRAQGAGRAQIVGPVLNFRRVGHAGLVLAALCLMAAKAPDSVLVSFDAAEDESRVWTSSKLNSVSGLELSAEENSPFLLASLDGPAAGEANLGSEDESELFASLDEEKGVSQGLESKDGAASDNAESASPLISTTWGEEIPEWANQGSRFEGRRLIGVGAGTSLRSAAAVALAGVARAREAWIRADESEKEGAPAPSEDLDAPGEKASSASAESGTPDAEQKAIREDKEPGRSKSSAEHGESSLEQDLEKKEPSSKEGAEESSGESQGSSAESLESVESLESSRSLGDSKAVEKSKSETRKAFPLPRELEAEEAVRREPGAVARVTQAAWDMGRVGVHATVMRSSQKGNPPSREIRETTGLKLDDGAQSFVLFVTRTVRKRGEQRRETVNIESTSDGYSFDDFVMALMDEGFEFRVHQSPSEFFVEVSIDARD